MKKKAFDYVAEYIFGHERGLCQPGITGAAAKGTIEQKVIRFSELCGGWYCRWCGCRHNADGNAVKLLPCPKFPFPAFNIVDLMRQLGTRSGSIIAIHLRYDPERAENNFTLIGPEGRFCDTDTPLTALCEWLVEREWGS